MSNLRDEAFKGISWSVFGKIAQRVINFAIEIALVRLLSPKEFGLVAMVVIFTGFARILQDVGFGAALVQHEDLNENHRSSVFWINILSGVLLTVIFAASSSLIANFYDNPTLVPIVVALSFNFLIGSFGVVHRKIFVRSIDFKSISLVEVTSTLVAGVIAIAMAWEGWGVWSLVSKYLVSSIVGTTTLWVVSAWRPQFFFSWKAIRDLSRFSLNLLGQRSLNFWLRRLDDLLIGRYLGSDPLGVYTKAYKVMLVPLQSVSRVIGRVMFPTLSSIQNDIPRVRRVFLKTTETIALITFPLTLGLLATVESFVIGVFGEKWSSMVPVLSVLCITSLWQSIATLNGNIYMSQGRTDLQLRVSMVMNPFIMAGIVIGLRWGVLGVAVGYTITTLVNGYVNFQYAGGLVGLGYSDLLYHLSGIFWCAAVMAGLVYAVGLGLPPEWPHWLQLLTKVPLGIGIYWVLVFSFGVRAYRETLDLVMERWNN